MTYVLNVYPYGSQLSRGLDAFVRCVIHVNPATIWPTIDTLHDIESYKQAEEEKHYDFNRWQRLDLHNVFFEILMHSTSSSTFFG